jgi:hypothetical protein
MTFQIITFVKYLCCEDSHTVYQGAVIGKMYFISA